MKLIMIVSLVSVFDPAYSQVKDKDAMVKKIFTVLQQKDKEGFIKLYPDAALTTELVKKIFVGEKSVLLEEILPLLTDSLMQLKFSEIFAETMDKSVEKGFDWSQAKLDSFLTDSSLDKQTNMPTMRGKIYFNAGSKDYFMSYSDIIWVENRGWYGVNIDRIDEKSKENEPEEFEKNPDADSVMMMQMDTAIAMPDTAIKIKEINPIKKTTPVKPLGKTVKPKSQTPAKKPE
jgi:hypothetical protein